MSQQLIDVLLRLDDRVSQLEQAFAGGSNPAAEAFVYRRPNVDPAVTDRVRVRQLEQLLRVRPPQPGDPAAADLVRARTQDILGNLAWSVDPPPDEIRNASILNASVLELVNAYRKGFIDPPPPDLANIRLVDLLTQRARNIIIDPAPTDYTRLNTVEELESRKHAINAEKIRLDSLERQIDERIATIKAQSVQAEPEKSKAAS
jgi:hypothetical protein